MVLEGALYSTSPPPNIARYILPPHLRFPNLNFPLDFEVGFVLPIFSEKDPPKKSPAKFTRKFAGKNSIGFLLKAFLDKYQGEIIPSLPLIS